MKQRSRIYCFPDSIPVSGSCFSCWLVIRRASILCDETVTLSEGLYYLEAMGSAGGQLGKLLKLRREMEEAEKNEDLARAMEGALEEVLKEWGGWIES